MVNGVKPGGLPIPAMSFPVAAPQHFVTLSSVEVDGLSDELQVVGEIEPGTKFVEKVAPSEPSGFDARRSLTPFWMPSAFPRYCRFSGWTSVVSTFAA